LNWVKIELVGPQVAIPFTQETFDESFQFKDINASLGGVKADFIAQLQALSE
jgi:hypothetical protein